MMRWIIRNSLRFRYLVVAGAIALMVFGVSATQKMPVDVFPEFAPPRVQILQEAPGKIHRNIQLTRRRSNVRHLEKSVHKRAGMITAEPQERYQRGRVNKDCRDHAGEAASIRCKKK